MEHINFQFLEIIFNNQYYVLFLMFIMIISGLSKENSIFIDTFLVLNKFIKSKRILLFFTSALTGILPVPGRVTITAGVLDTIAPTDPIKRSKFGIIDYLSTHHYYLWSPIEKTVIIPMAVLGLSYSEFIGHIYPLLIFSIILIIGYIFFNIKEDDIELNFSRKKIKYNRLFQIVPFISGIIFIANGFNAAIVFSIVTAWYIGFFKPSITQIYSYINFKLLFLIFSIILIGNYIHLYTEDINTFIKHLNYSMNNPIDILLIASISFLAAFLMGSSSRFSGIVALLSLTFGVKYLLFFFAVEFAAYLLSPVHKCTTIGRMYFGTSFQKYYLVLSIWSIGLILISILITFF